ncbi:hypothetical protein BDQ17DRAFT_1329318 [Cyathus striatus]|nr:hypothetical protein BDQ17DRAFT_1329318 [Cyathus striatus]
MERHTNVPNYIGIHHTYHYNATRITAIVLETIIFILTFAKRNVNTLHTNIVNKVVRDGRRFYAFMIVQAIHTAYMTYLFIWRLTIFSILACRLIKGLLQISAEPLMNHSSTSNDDVELTSFVNLLMVRSEDKDSRPPPNPDLVLPPMADPPPANPTHPLGGYVWGPLVKAMLGELEMGVAVIICNIQVLVTTRIDLGATDERMYSRTYPLCFVFPCFPRSVVFSCPVAVAGAAGEREREREVPGWERMLRDSRVSCGTSSLALTEVCLEWSDTSTFRSRGWSDSLLEYEGGEEEVVEGEGEGEGKVGEEVEGKTVGAVGGVDDCVVGTGGTDDKVVSESATVLERVGQFGMVDQSWEICKNTVELEVTAMN